MFDASINAQTDGSYICTIRAKSILPNSFLCLFAAGDPQREFLALEAMKDMGSSAGCAFTI